MSDESENSEYVNDYIRIDKEYIKKYGEKIAILMQVGAFYELFYESEERAHYVLYETMNISKRIIKNTSIFTGGFPDTALKKYIKLLVQSDFIVVVYDQAPDPKNSRKKIRIFSAKYSGPTCIDDEELCFENDMICCIYMEYTDSLISEVYMCTYEPSTGNNTCIITHAKTYSEIIKTISKINPKEIVIYTDDCTIEKAEIAKNLNLEKKMYHLRINCVPAECKKISYQNEFLGKLFTCKLLTPIEYLNIGRYPSLIINYILLLSFMYEFNPFFLSKLSNPSINTGSSNLDYSENCIEQFNLIDKDKNSLFNIINHTSTLGGKRLLKQILLAPTTDKLKIQYRYGNIEKMISEFKQFESLLDNVSDLEKFHRKMHLAKFKPTEFLYLDKSYTNIIGLIQLSEKYNICNDLISVTDKTNFSQLYGYYRNYINLENLNGFNLDDDIKVNIFAKGFNLQLDKYFDFFAELNKYLSGLAKTYADSTGRSEPLKIEETKGKKTTAANEYSFHVTESQKNILRPMYTDLEFTGKASGYRVTSQKIRDCSEKMSDAQSKINTITRSLYAQFINYISLTFSDTFEKISIFSNTIDFVKSCAKCAVLNKYCKPIIKDVGKSFVNTKTLRHPSIEKILQKTQYIPNDCNIGDDVDGMLLYGPNSSGKSSYLRSIGISVMLAQSGMYVPAEEFIYGIYKKLSIKITGADDIYTSKSYFTNECLHVKNFLQIADPNTLIIGDELFKGTETSSEIALVASVVSSLSQKKCTFIFATHLHQILELDIVNSCSNVQPFHIDMIITPDKLEHDRKIKKGKCVKQYGVEIASFLGLETEFISKAYKTRNLLLEGKTEYLSTKTSNYNSSIYMDKCKVCDSTTNLITHHIVYQNEFLEGSKIPFDKNAPHNLAVICEKCHNEVHNGNLKIKGYIETGEGTKLDFSRN
jgi:DNA mismatch repair protein MutS